MITRFDITNSILILALSQLNQAIKSGYDITYNPDRNIEPENEPF